MTDRQTVTIDPETGKAALAKGRHSEACKKLLTHHNNLVDHLQLLKDPDVVSHLLYGTKADIIAKKPQPIQDAFAGFRKLLEQRLTQAKVDDQKEAQQAIDQICDKLTEQHEQTLAELKKRLAEEHELVVQAKERELRDMCDTVGMHNRTETYQQHVRTVVNAYLRNTNSGVPEQGIHPVGHSRLVGGQLHSDFRIYGLRVSIVANVGTEDGELHDWVKVATDKNSGLPAIHLVSLETHASHPGLTLNGINDLISVLNSLSPKWYASVKGITNEGDLAQIYVDPQAAEDHFEECSPERALGSTALRLAFGVTSRPQPDTITRAGSSAEDLYVLRDQKPSARQHFAVAAASYWPCGANPASNGTPVQPVDDPDYVQSHQTKE